MLKRAFVALILAPGLIGAAFYTAHSSEPRSYRIQLWQPVPFEYGFYTRFGG